MEAEQLTQLEQTGYDSWIELYIEICKARLQNDETVDLEWPEQEHPTRNWSMLVIVTNAFSELYDQLPTVEAKDVVISMLTDLCNDGAVGAKPIIEFLTKIPTRIS